MNYRFVATPTFAQQWFKQGVNRESLRAAPALIFNAKDQLHTAYIQQKFGLNPTQYPHHFIPSSSAFFDAVTMGLATVGCPITKPNRVCRMAHRLR